MKASKFSEAQIAFVLKQAEDGTPIGRVWCGAISAAQHRITSRADCLSELGGCQPAGARVRAVIVVIVAPV
ncbi:hypothetical protein GGD52_003898 [Agrobacterium tumefaciens]|nr:hypothetical protein [Agrobacterium radiobacter]MBB5589277.1 hypothetical protein [Agrobacterium radiobacter]